MFQQEKKKKKAIFWLKSESFGMFGGKESAYRVLVEKFQAMKQPKRHKHR
jgi:hypothetical protein